MGMDGLSILDKIKAECANITYESTCELMRCLHYHQKWNAEVIDGRVVFPTGVEAAYPILLCERLATIAKLKALELGATEIQDLARQIEHAPSSQHRFLLDMLPKGRKFKPLVSEYGFTATNMNFSEQQFLHNFPKEQRLCIDRCTRVFFGSMQVKTMTSNVTRHACRSTLHMKS